MPGFFVKSENISEDRILIRDKSDIHHISRVLRHEIGDRLVLTEPNGFIYEAEIINVGYDVIETRILSKYPSQDNLNIEITLAQSVLKSQKQEIVIQKASELGATRIIPYISKNTVVRFDSEKDKTFRVKRWQKIAAESAKQCGRNNITEIGNIINFGELIEFDNFDVTLVCSEKEKQLSIKEHLQKNRSKVSRGSKILVITGPEGGFDETEINLFKEKNFPTITLGNLVLRAETAAITALSDIIYEFEL